MTRVWPALWPPWKRTTTSARSESQSTILPLPSSPHWAPTTATLLMTFASTRVLSLARWRGRSYTGQQLQASAAMAWRMQGQRVGSADHPRHGPGADGDCTGDLGQHL